MPNRYSQDPLLCSITNRGAASCLLSGNLAVWHEVCDSKKTLLSFLCLVMSLLGRLHVVLPSSGWFGCPPESLCGPSAPLQLGQEEGRSYTFSSTAWLLCFCLNFLQSLKHDTFQHVSPALSILLPPTSVPFPLACEMYYS